MLCKRFLYAVSQSFKITKNTRFFSKTSSYYSEDINPKDSLFCFTEDEKQLKESVAEFSRKRVLPLVREMEETGVPSALIKELFENGLMSLEVAGEYGGMQSSFFSSLLAIEELAKVDMGVSLYADLQNTLINNLFSQLGTAEQKLKYLPQLCSNMIGSFCLSEEHSGSDAFALRTTARKEGPKYIINGSKMWISHAMEAGVFLVMANAKPEMGYKGITCFIVDSNCEGVQVGRKEDKLGLRSSNTCPVHFDDVEVSEDSVLGQVGEGYKYAIGMLNGGRIGIGAQLVGVAQGCLDHTIPYLLSRKQFGQSIYEFQGLNHQVAQAVTKVEAARVLVYNAGRMKEKGLPYVKEAAMAKYYASEVACEVTSRCIEWLGGVGICKTFPVEKYYRDCKVGTIYEGTSNIQLSTIAKEISRSYADTP